MSTNDHVKIIVGFSCINPFPTIIPQVCYTVPSRSQPCLVIHQWMSLSTASLTNICHCLLPAVVCLLICKFQVLRCVQDHHSCVQDHPSSSSFHLLSRRRGEVSQAHTSRFSDCCVIFTLISSDEKGKLMNRVHVEST